MKTYTSMWVLGNHYHVDVDKTRPRHETLDSGVAVITNEWRGGYVADMNIQFARLDKVGILEEILALSYSTIQVVILRVSWVVRERGGGGNGEA